jgi:hypothetical protein
MLATTSFGPVPLVPALDLGGMGASTLCTPTSVVAVAVQSAVFERTHAGQVI